MASVSASFSRTTSLLVNDQLLRGLRATQTELAEVQRQIATGKAVESPSDAPDKVSAILVLESRLEARVQEEKNTGHGVGVLNNVDGALGDISALLLEAKSIASSQIGIGSDAGTRKAEAAVIDAQIQALVDIANRQFQNVSLFGGNSSLGLNATVFDAFLGGVRYRGATANIQGDYGLGAPADFNSNGVEAFGALSTRVISPVDLDPQLVAATRLNALNGAQGAGIRRGAINLDVDGTIVSVDLSTADTAGDVVTRINEAINAIDPAAGSLAINAGQFELTAAVGHTIALADVDNGQTAGDLGVELTSVGGVAATGADVDPRLTELTTLASLGVAVDFASGLQITNGGVTKTVNFTGATTIQDMVNTIANLGIGVRLQINAAGTGVNLVSEVSGVELSVGENGGTTAQDLGLRSFAPETLLADFRNGLGVEIQPGVDDFSIQLHNGTVFNVNLDGATNAQEVLDAISLAATTAGLTVGAPGAAGTDFNLGMAPTGNGFRFEDNTAGAADFAVNQLNRSLAATHLGIFKNAATGSVIGGDDVARVKTDSVFTHLIALRDALLANDSAGITLAGTGLERSIDLVAEARAGIGVKTQRLEQQQERLQQLQIAEESTLSQLRDADLTEVITRLAQLQQQLQASLRSGVGASQLSLLDFLN